MSTHPASEWLRDLVFLDTARGQDEVPVHMTCVGVLVNCTPATVSTIDGDVEVTGGPGHPTIVHFETLLDDVEWEHNDHAGREIPVRLRVRHGLGGFDGDAWLRILVPKPEADENVWEVTTIPDSDVQTVSAHVYVSSVAFRGPLPAEPGAPDSNR